MVHMKTPMRRYAPVVGAIGGLLVLLLAISALSGGDSDEKEEASVADETPVVAEVVEPDEPVEPVEPDAATETQIVEPVTVDAGVETMVFDPPKPESKPVSKNAKANALFLSGRKKLAKSDLRGAKKDLSAALKLRPGHGGTIKAMARVYEKVGLKSKALQFYRNYLKRSPRAKDRKTIEAKIRSLGG